MHQVATNYFLHPCMVGRNLDEESVLLFLALVNIVDIVAGLVYPSFLFPHGKLGSDTDMGKTHNGRQARDCQGGVALSSKVCRLT